MTNVVKVCVVDMQPITPAVGGGRLRLLGLYHDLGPGVDTTYVGTYDWPGEAACDRRLTPRLREVCIPLSDAHHAAAIELSKRLGGKTVIDSAFSMQAFLSVDWDARAREAIRDADVVVFSHPWAYSPLSDSLRDDQLVVYDAHNVESLLKATLLGLDGDAGELVREVIRNEYALCRRADLVLTCSHDDIEVFVRMFALPRRAMRVVPNGAFTNGKAGNRQQARVKARESLDLPADARIAIFMGSNYGPNVDAARFIADSLCRAMPEVTFVILGGVGDAIDSAMVPFNLRLTGVVDDTRRDTLLHGADLAINPMSAGSGTNIKMFDFLAAGLPVVTTDIGARGICDATTAPPFILVRSLADFPASIAESLFRPAGRRAGAEDPQDYVKRLFSWETISSQLGNLLRSARQRKCRSLTVRSDGRAWLIGTWNIRCGIAEHASYLVAEMSRQGWDVLVIGNRLEGHLQAGVAYEMHYPVARAWTWDSLAWRDSGIDADRIDALLAEDRPDVAVIQHHTGFMPALGFQELMRKLRAAGVRVIIEFHDARNIAEVALADLIQHADLAVFHDAQEMDAVPEALRAACLVQPLPVPGLGDTDAEAPGQADNAGPVIGGFGFLRPYKGVLTTIRVVALLHGRHPGIRYRGFHAVYDAESIRHLEECRQEAARLGIADSIEIDTAFHPLSEVVSRLSATDVVLLPYEASNEGASAAVNCALAAGRAAVVSAAKIFRPVANCVHVVPDDDPAAYSDVVARLLADPADRSRLEHAARQWADQNSYSAVVRRLFGGPESGVEYS